MADVKYIIDVEVKGAVNGLKGLQGEISRTTTALAPLRNALGLVTAALSVSALTKFSDGVTNLKNKLSTLQPDAKKVNDQFKALVAVSLQARAPLEATGDLFFRISRAADSMGISQREALSITESLAKAMTSTGLSAAEAAGPLLQIGQALQSGRFQGDELRSVLEGMPTVSKALADELGVPVGKLKELGSQGVITSDVFVRAMRNAKDSIDEAFGRTVPTISQAFQQLQTSISFAFNNFQENTEVGKSFAVAIQLLAINIFELSETIDANKDRIAAFIAVLGGLLIFKTITPILIGFGTAIVDVLVALGIVKVATTAAAAGTAATGAAAAGASKGFLGLAGSIIKNLTPIGRLVGIILGLGASLLAAFDIQDAVNNFFKLGEGTDDLSDRFNKFNKKLDEYKNKIDSSVSGQLKLSQAQLELNQRIRQQTEELERSVRAYNDQAEQQQKTLRQSIENVGATKEQIRLTNALSDAESSYLNEAKRLQDELYKLKKSDKAEDKAQIPVIIGLLAELDKKYKNNVASVTELVGKLNERLAVERQLMEMDAVDDAVAAYQRQNDKLNQNIALETAKLRLSEQQRSVVDQLYSLEQERLNAVQPLLEKINDIKRTGSEEDKATIPVLEEGIARINQKYMEQSQILNDLLVAKEQELRIAKLGDFVTKERLDTERQLRKIQDDIAKVSMSDIERKYYDIAASARESAKAAIAAEEARRGKPLDTSEIENYYRVARENADRLIRATEEHESKSREWSSGWKRAYKEYVSEATNAAKKAESLFKKATQGMEDMIVNFAKTGKFEWKSFVSSMLEELLRAQIQQIFAGLMTSMTNSMGGGSSNILGSLGSIFGGGSNQNQGGGILDSISGLFGSGTPGSSSSNPLYVLPVNGSSLGGGGFGGQMGSQSGGGGVLDSISTAVGGIWDGIKSFGGGVIDTVGSVVSGISDLFGGGSNNGGGFVGGGFGSVGTGGSSWFDDITSGIGDFFGGFFANGGQLGAGKWGIAGENGPELISGPASITPMSPTNVTYNINAVDAMSFKQLLSQDPGYIYALTIQGSKGVPARR